MAAGKLLARALASAEGTVVWRSWWRRIAKLELDPHTAAQRLIEAAE